MAAVNLQAQVFELVVEASEVKPENVLLTTRLVDDLGLDGDDAAEFFNRVHERFGTDLTHLHFHWHEHFGSEGIPCTAVPVIIVAALVGGLMGIVAGPGHGNGGGCVGGIDLGAPEVGFGRQDDANHSGSGRVRC